MLFLNVMNKLDTQKFIIKATGLFKDLYDYSEVYYINSKSKVKIICKEHGEFWQQAGSHLSGCGRPKCAVALKAIKESKDAITFIKEANTIHNYKYNYDYSNYTNNKTKIKNILLYSWDI